MIFKLYFRYDDNYLHQIISDDFIDMDDPEVPQQVKDNIEFVLDVSNSDSHVLHVELKKNHTRAEQAKQTRQQVLDEDRRSGNTERIDKDVLVFYIDNISRPNFHRKLKKLSAWLSQYADGAELEQVEVSSMLTVHRARPDTSKQRNTRRMSTLSTIHLRTSVGILIMECTLEQMGRFLTNLHTCSITLKKMGI